MADAIIILQVHSVHREAHRHGCRVTLSICNQKATIFFIRDNMVHALDDCFTQYYSILLFIPEQITTTSGNMSSFVYPWKTATNIHVSKTDRRCNRLYAFNLVAACKHAGVPLISGRLTAHIVSDA
ncbi:hypothetical protein Goari_020521 [Gossypium aridum]|uniref:Uncharacterized protein n=1 Tax=Gossypium aridum TaxID=34290 RepID=A0A7J8YR97_GOSAI|nr:hypothetical protein [Gossypium aridum]